MLTICQRNEQPVGLVVDGTGMVFVTDQHNNRIRKITASASSLPWREMAHEVYQMPSLV